MVDPQLIEILVCPDTRQPVELASAELIERLNAAIGEGALRNRGGDVVQDLVDGGLVREDGEVLYPIRDDIPVMLIDEAITLSSLE